MKTKILYLGLFIGLFSLMINVISCDKEGVTNTKNNYDFFKLNAINTTKKFNYLCLFWLLLAILGFCIVLYDLLNQND